MKFNYIKITHKEQKEYMINFLNIGNNTIISINKNLEQKLKIIILIIFMFNILIVNLYLICMEECIA